MTCSQQNDENQPIHLFYGGNFDPIHRAHLHVATSVAEAFDAPVTLIPTGDPPHRADARANAEQRLAMVRLSISGDEHLRVDTRELDQARTSYTHTTLTDLRAELGEQTPVAWVMGADSFLSLPSWFQWQNLFELAHFVVIGRPGHDFDGMDEALREATKGRWADDVQALCDAPCGRVFRLDVPLRPESSSQIRAAIADGLPDWRQMVAPEVVEYIATQRLYGFDEGE